MGAPSSLPPLLEPKWSQLSKSELAEICLNFGQHWLLCLALVFADTVGGIELLIK